MLITGVMPLTFAKMAEFKGVSKFLLSFLRFFEDLKVCASGIRFLAKKRKKYLTGCEKKRYIRVRTALCGHNFKKRERIMNKKILSISAVLAAAALSFGFETWNGADGVARVETGLDAGEDNSGYWYFYADGADGGASVVQWAAEPDPDYGGLEPVLEACGDGICGTYTLDKGTLDYDPFIGIGFNVGGADAAGKAIPVDVSSLSGVCISFSVDHAATLELGLGDATDAKIGYANPAYDLGKSATAVKTANVPWSKFAQPSWAKADQSISIDEALATVASIKMKVQAKTGSAGQFKITQVGEAGKCGEIAIGAKALQSSLKAQLAGRTLSFGKSVAKAEIVNLQGQVVMAASSVKTMDLSKLQAGVYMVRAMGLSQQIMLK